MGLSNKCLKTLFSVSAPPPPAPLLPENIALMAVENFQRQRDPGAVANMSRRRFFCTQLNSLIIAVLTCLTVCIFTLTKVENVNEFMFGQCGMLSKILKNLTGINLTANDTNFCSSSGQPNSSEL
jgi:uncharacterized protein YkvS